MNKLKLLVVAASIALANTAHAETFDLSFSGGGFVGSGTVTATSNGDGTFTATGGAFTFSLGDTAGQTYYLDPIPAGGSSVTLANIQDSGGVNLTVDDILGPGYISNADDGALMFSFPAQSGNINPTPGDVIALYQNSDGSYGFLGAGVDFSSPGTQYITENGTGSVEEAPEPSIYAMMFSGLGFLGLRVRRKLV
jgi:hypothetical protein